MNAWLWAASLMLTHPVPVGEQRDHWYLNAIGAVPVQLPLWAVKTLPTTGEPVTEGRVVFVGGPVAAAAPTAPTAATSAVASAALSRDHDRQAHLFLLRFISKCLLPP